MALCKPSRPILFSGSGHPFFSVANPIDEKAGKSLQEMAANSLSLSEPD
jgi:hypothetical protein